MRHELPADVVRYLPDGHEASQGVWLVLPEAGTNDRDIESVNAWLRAEDWYPPDLQDVVWFGDDGVGNYFGWRPSLALAVLWNPEDGDEPWRVGQVRDLWDFVVAGYKSEP